MPAFCPLGVGSDGLVDPGPAGQPPHDPAGGVPVETLTSGVEEDRPFEPLSDGQVDRSGRAGGQRDGNDLAALAGHGEGSVAPVEAGGADVAAEGFADPEPVNVPQGD